MIVILAKLFIEENPQEAIKQVNKTKKQNLKS